MTVIRSSSDGHGDHQRKQQERQREPQVDEAHDYLVDHAAVVPRDDAGGGACKQAEAQGNAGYHE